ncbi:MAG: AAA family ATPase [Candidatus Kapabacteria bacterium]|nr:AAA family ATPase [Candidatus Kapabacteria bacterium]
MTHVPQQYPLSAEIADAHFQRCEELLDFSSGMATRKCFLLLRPLLRDILVCVTENELQFFSTLYARLLYVADKFSIDKDIRQHAHELLRATTKLKRQPSLECTEDDCRAGCYIITEIISALSGKPIPATVGETFKTTSLLFRKSMFTNESTIIPIVRCVVRNVHAMMLDGKTNLVLECSSEDFADFTLHVWDSDSYSLTDVWVGATLHLLHSKIQDDGKFTTTSRTMIVIEPDMLMDATAIAECFQGQTAEPLLYFLDRMTESSPSQAMAIGSVVNFCLDEMLQSDEWDVTEFIRRAYKAKPLAMLAGFEASDDEVSHVAGLVSEHLERLQTTITQLEYDSIITEPSFISPLYGIQGRLDLLLEYSTDDKRKTVIELKSGSAPKPTFHQSQAKNGTAADGMWMNHAVQVSCYNMLLDSAYTGRTGDSQILYSKAGEYPLRNAPNVTAIRQRILAVRNRIITLEHWLVERRFTVFSLVVNSEFGVPAYKRDALDNFRHFYTTLTQQERLYIQAWTSFLVRENYSQRVGGTERSSGFAALWRDSLDEKIEQFSVLPNLRYNPDESDTVNMHLRFDFTEATPETSALRDNDIVVVYPTRPDGTIQPHKGQMVRGIVKQLNDTSVVISLRNKQFNPGYFLKSSVWHCEPDFIDASSSSMLSSLFRLFHIEERKRRVLLGLEKPHSVPLTIDAIANATDEQQQLIEAALSAQDYFLLQGPPGTGKTSVMLKNIIHQLHQNPDETILVCSYTNRALDEVCAAIRKVTPSVDVLRLGSRDNTEHAEISFYQIAQTDEIHAVRRRLTECRIIASTVSFAQANPELFALKSFTTLVLDEASQVTEPQLMGLASRVRRCIFIGDEKQLPAVITQRESDCNVNHPLLADLGVHDMRQSLFERLLRKCIEQGWHHAYGMLTKQARMNMVVQDYPSREFYAGKLQPMLEAQRSYEPTVRVIEGYGRIAFLPSRREHKTKINQGEAILCSNIITDYVEKLGSEFHAHSIGVIAPFRAQIHEIRSRLTPHLRKLVTVDTVERFQGSERDVIVLSCAVNNSSQLSSLQSLIEFDGTLIDRKLNVAITRAREQFILIGCEDILRQSFHYHRLIEYIHVYQTQRRR